MIRPIAHTIKLQMEDTGTRDTGLRIKQNDAGVVLYIYVYYNGELFFDENLAPNVVFRKPNGTAVVGQCTFDSSGYYIYTIVGNELTTPGTVVMDVKFMLEAGRESTHSVTFECVQDTVTENVEISNIRPEDLISYIEKLEKEIVQIREAINDAEKTIDDIDDTMKDENVQAVANAVQLATQSAQTATESATNAESYAQTSEESATSAGTSATNAGTSATNAGTSATRAEEAKTAAEQARDRAETANEDCQRIKASIDGYYVDLTWAEYEALPQSEKMSGKIFNITDRGIVYEDGQIPHTPTKSVHTAIEELNENLTKMEIKTISATFGSDGNSFISTEDIPLDHYPIFAYAIDKGVVGISQSTFGNRWYLNSTAIKSQTVTVSIVVLSKNS